MRDTPAINDIELSTRDVADICEVSTRTVADWRRGYYFSGSEKRYYFDDHARLPAVWDDNQRCKLHRVDDVKRWVIRLRNKK